LKKLLPSFIVLITFANSYAQPQDANGLNKIQQAPVFTIIAAPDSVAFSSGQLPKGKPLVLIFFNPDCEHCQKETKELLAYKEELKDIPIVMSSALPYKLVKEFYADYNIASMPNIAMGQDINFALGSKYRPSRYPAIFVYDTTGKLTKVFAGGGDVPSIIEATK
jgi:thiol-disulfide isomerase/thioredoxin